MIAERRLVGPPLPCTVGRRDAPLPCYSPDVINRAADPRTADRIAYEVLKTPAGADVPQVIGHATFSRGTTAVDAEENVAVAIRELLARPFVDRVQADERPRGYRRSGHGQVDLLVPGMAEHFIARMRGLWLSYPDGSVVTAREEAATSELPGSIVAIPDATEMAPGVADPTLRRGTLEATGETAGGPPLVRPHAPLSGLRPAGEAPPVHRTDCGWIV
jgi:hypothetical protein